MIKIPGIGIVKNDDPRAIAYLKGQKQEKTYLDKRLEEYGSALEQLEYIAEHGIAAFKSRQISIKEKYPKE